MRSLHHSHVTCPVRRGRQLAEARARISQAIENGARLFPPLETETWPASRPLAKWLLRLLPPDRLYPAGVE
jgi:hypothetical protein